LSSCSSSNDKIYRCENYYETVIPKQRLSTFKSHFRMSPSTFEAILQQIAICPEVRKKDQNMHGGRRQINIEKTLLIVFWTLTTPDSYTGCLMKNASTHNFFVCYPISVSRETEDMIFHVL
jgi:hypothetical protein